MGGLKDYAGFVCALMLVLTVVAKAARGAWRERPDSSSSPFHRVVWLLGQLIAAPLFILMESCVLLLYFMTWGLCVAIVSIPLSFLAGTISTTVLMLYGFVSALFFLKLYWDDALFQGESGPASLHGSYNSAPATTAQNTVIIPSHTSPPSYTSGGSGGSSLSTPQSGYGSTYGPAPGHSAGNQATTNYN